MKRVLWIFNHYVTLPPAPGGVRHLSLAHELRERGWDVCLVSARTQATQAGTRAGTLPPRRLVDVDGVKVLTLRVPGYVGNGPRRVANMAAFAAAASLPHVTRGLPRPDVVIGSSVHPAAAWAAQRHARRLRARFVFEIRDLWPETFVSLGRMERTSAVARSLYALEASLWAHAELILSPLGQIPLYAADQALPERPFLHVPNGVNTAQFDPQWEPHGGPTRLGYFGLHGNTDYLEIIIEALAEPAVRSRADELSVQLYGQGPRKLALQEMAARLALTNLEFHDPLDRTRVPPAMRSMDGFLFPCGQSKGLYKYGASPNKLQEYMAAGRPILLNAPFQGDPVTASGGGGIVVPDCTPTDWAKGLLEFLDVDRERRQEMGARVRTLAEEKYDFSILGATLDRGLHDLIAT